jgi:uncharacterized protein YndB with AHSA1/START domain
MIRVELDTTIARSIEDVFAQLTDLAGYSRWMPRRDLFIRSDVTSAGPMGVGTTYYDKTWMGVFRGEVVAFHAPTAVVFRETLRWLGMRVMEARPAYQLVATEAGTEVHHVAEGTFYGIFRLMAPVGPWMARGERKRTLRALKQALESAPAYQEADAHGDRDAPVLAAAGSVGASETLASHPVASPPR